MNKSHTLSTPPRINGLLEYRALFDLATLPFRLSHLKIRSNDNVGKGRHVFVLPGFGASDTTMYPLRYFLKQHGFIPYGWGLGVNKAGLNLKHDPHSLSWDFVPLTPYRREAGVPYLCDLMVDKIRQHHKQTGQKVSLVGWSLGGTIAREVARDLPELVEQVVTLGSPYIGGPKYTAAAKLLAKRGLNLDWIEKQVERRNAIPMKTRLSAIVSPSDGIVDVSASIVPNDNTTRYIKANVAHLGMGISSKTFELVLSELQR